MATENSLPPPEDYRYLQLFVFALFFFFGGITSLNDVIIPKLKDLFTLSYAEVMTVQSAFFGAYFLVSLPAATVLRKIGYMRSAVLGLGLMMSGCFLFIPASSSAIFWMFLLALFVVASGITIVQVVANPLISLLGSSATVHSRLTFAQAFNSLGTTLFPFVGSRLILASLANAKPAAMTEAALTTYRRDAAHVIESTYLCLAFALLIIIVLVWLYRNQVYEEASTGSSVREMADLTRLPRFAFGAACIFLYVGAEVAIGSLLINYLMQKDVLGIGPRAAGEHVPLYWGGAMIGRFMGAYLLRLISPGKVLAAAAAAVVCLIFTSSHTTGAVCGYSLLAIGLFNSIMFPTIFSLASEGLGQRAASASGIICIAIVGGAVAPPITGYVADVWSLRTALFVPAICYVGILAYGIYARRPAIT